MYFAPSWYAPRNTGDTVGVGERFEAIIERFYRSILRRGGLALDCGAHVGRHTFPLAECVGSSGVVHAIEPLTRLAVALRAECARRGFSQARVLEVAIDKTAGTSAFVDVQALPAYSGLRIRDLPSGDMNIRMATVITTTIDKILETESRKFVPPAFWKLDLEGGELNALKGAQGSLGYFQPILAFENGRDESARQYGYSKEHWYGFFTEIDYVVLDLFGNPFDEVAWTAPDIPWYSIAFPRRHPLAAELPERLRAISEGD